MAQHDRREDQRQERHCGPPPRPWHAMHRDLSGQVGDKLVELAKGLRGVAAIEAVLQLLGLEPPGEMLVAEEVSELAERMDMSMAHASLVVGELAAGGLIDRDHDERDRRRIIVSLSRTAKPAVAEMRDRHAAPLRRFLTELDDAEAERFIDQLTTLIAYLREEPAEVRAGSGREPRQSSA